ncbi:hypothetical protein [Edwardsiella ictaluri]|uniref:hypothetical protein n=1 Tax=Edwardsiella ictaluri TaxID=67780 RepID=UPI003A59937C
MSVVHTHLNLFGGDTLIVRCAHAFSVHLASDENPHLQQASATASVNQPSYGELYLSIPFSGLWSLIIDAQGDSGRAFHSLSSGIKPVIGQYHCPRKHHASGEGQSLQRKTGLHPPR